MDPRTVQRRQTRVADVRERPKKEVSERVLPAHRERERPVQSGPCSRLRSIAEAIAMITRFPCGSLLAIGNAREGHCNSVADFGSRYARPDILHKVKRPPRLANAPATKLLSTRLKCPSQFGASQDGAAWERLHQLRLADPTRLTCTSSIWLGAHITRRYRIL